jgi:peptidoglycan/LPS O-acetylase OafA/YrhL
MTLTQHRPETARTTASYGGRMSLLLAVAFALSATHTTYGYLTGLGDPRFTVTTPVAWVFYALGFATAAAARSRRRWLQVAVVGCLAVMIAVAVFYYPTTFVPRQQTTFGWFENDVYTGLLMVAAYLGVQQLRGVTLTGRS